MSEKLLAHPKALMNIVRRIAYDAGEVTLDYFDESGYSGAMEKGDGSPVTEADRAAEALIEKALAETTPDIPFVGEEAVEAGRIPDLSGADYFWLVDALDGTKEFISGNGDYTVNIALMKRKGDLFEPFLGVIYVPVKGELYAGCGAGTAMRWMEDTDKEKEIYVRAAPREGLTIAASLSHGNTARLEKFLEGHKIAKITKRASSLKICMVASGKADLYPRFGPTCEWDIAAGHAILHSAGGDITDLDGKPMTYGHADRKFLNPEFIAAPKDSGLFSDGDE